VIAVRFWLLWAATLVFVINSRLLSRITPGVLLWTALIGVAAMVLPLYFLQKSVETIGADRTGIYMGFSPLIVIAFEAAIFDELDLLTVLPIVVLPVVILGCEVYQRHWQQDTQFSAGM
jgi:drug/metabolite transporter (DMT)-like permease